MASFRLGLIMALSPLSDVSPADWFVSSDADWWNKVCLGPPGFDAYVRVFDDVSDDAHEDAAEQVGFAIRSILAAHTSTAEACYFALWDGWGSLEGGPQDTGLRWAVPRGFPQAYRDKARRRTLKAKRVNYAPAFPVDFLRGPKVRVPNRDFYLFEGPLTADFDWGAADFEPGFPRDIPNDPALMWPYDHAWFAASDVDPDWIGIGGSWGLINELLEDPRLDVALTTYDATDWEIR